MDVMMMSDIMHMDTNNISQDDVEKLRKMLPRDLQQPGKSKPGSRSSKKDQCRGSCTKLGHTGGATHQYQSPTGRATNHAAD